MTQTAPFLQRKLHCQFALTWASGRHQCIAYVPRRLIVRSRFTGTFPLLCVVTQGMFGQKSEPGAMHSSFDRNDIKLYFDFVFDLNGSARDAYGAYAEVALLERCGTAVVSRL